MGQTIRGLAKVGALLEMEPVKSLTVNAQCNRNNETCLITTPFLNLKKCCSRAQADTLPSPSQKDVQVYFFHSKLLPRKEVESMPSFLPS